MRTKSTQGFGHKLLAGALRDAARTLRDASLLRRRLLRASGSVLVSQQLLTRSR